MKVVLTGASGMLGGAVQDELVRLGWTCDVLAHGKISKLNPGELAARLAGADVLIHAAANTNVEQCEIDPDTCYQDNFVLTSLLARAAARMRVKLVYISSTGIYGEAKRTSYKEYDEVVPTTHHHTSKFQGEQAVMQADAGNLVIRTGWLFGGKQANPKNFVARRIDEAMAAQQAGATLSSNQEQRGVPCFNRDVAERVLSLVIQDRAGTFNCVNEGSASRFEYVAAIVRLAGIAVDVVPSGAQAFNRKARVSSNEAAENWRMACEGFAPMPAWEASLASYIQTLQHGIEL